MTGCDFTAHLLENTQGTADKQYWIVYATGDDTKAGACSAGLLAFAWGARGKRPTQTKVIRTVEAFYESQTKIRDRRDHGYEVVADLTGRFPDTLTRVAGDGELLWDAVYAAWHRNQRPATDELTTCLDSWLAAAASTAEMMVVALPKFWPVRGRVGGTRDARAWGPTLDDALVAPHRVGRDVVAAVPNALTGWLTTHYPRVRFGRLRHGSDPAEVLPHVALLLESQAHTLPAAVDLAEAIVC